MADFAPFKQPKLVLHLEADTMAELMDMLDAIVGDMNPDAMRQVQFGTTDNGGVGLVAGVQGGTADAATTKSRGRPRKTPEPETTTPPAEPAAPAAVTAIADPAQATQAVQTTVAPPVAPAAPAATHAMTPAAMREQGIQMVREWFAKDPSRLAEITALSGKLGVAMFDQVTDADAPRFLAEVTMLVNGTTNVAG